MNFKRFTTPLMLTAVLLTSSAGVSAGNDKHSDSSNGKEKIAVCHVNGNGSAKLINVSGRAAAAHSMHGDGVPGSDVAGMDNYVYDDNCVPVEVQSAIAAGCYDSRSYLDLDFNGKNGAVKNSTFSFSTSGSCSGTMYRSVTLVEADTALEASAKCSFIGADSANAIGVGTRGYMDLPDTAYLC